MLKKLWLQKRNLSSRPIKIYTLLLLVLVLTWLFVYYLYLIPTSFDYDERTTNDVNQFLFQQYKQFAPKEYKFTGARIVHLDLKGAPPKISYYKSLFPLLSQLGATGVLIEYEDMFPYSGSTLTNISALNAYTLEDINVINSLAVESNLEIIPLIQTFGHMEFILKLEEFKELREVYEYPQVICPTHEKTLPLLMDMISQVMNAHPNSKRLHIGADEVYNLGVCDRCIGAINKYNLSKNMLFLNHVYGVANNIHKMYPDLEILMWDDEFRGFTLKELKDGYLNKIVQPVVWKYSKEVYEELGPSLWAMYSNAFPKLWIASAFKGATGSNQYTSDVTHYVQNHRSWLSLIQEYQNQINFQGIIITGWQRYDHFAILCELLPVGLPALAMSLRIIMGYNDSPLTPPMEVVKILGCDKPYGLMGPVFGTPKCSFPGGDILENVLRLQQLKQEYETILEDSRMKGWFSEYNIAHGFSNPQYIQSVTAPLGRIKMELGLIEDDITSAMYDIYDNYTVNEWKDTYMRPLQRQVDTLWEAKDKILTRSSWPRRPLGEINEL